MPAHLVLCLDAPLTAFGGEVIDNYGVVRPFPGRSTIAGLLGNALGFDRAEGERLDRLQERLVMGSLRLDEGRRMQDFQTARLSSGDYGWTTRGRREGREGGLSAEGATHIRYRDADADALLLVVLRLEPPEEAPTLATVEAALDRPERPLFLGRKPFLPSRPLCAGTVEAPGVAEALAQGAAAALAGERRFRLHASRLRGKGSLDRSGGFRAQWPAGEDGSPDALEDETGRRRLAVCDERNWVSGVHGGLRDVVEGLIAVPQEVEP